jgi:hypothetical protein
LDSEKLWLILFLLAQDQMPPPEAQREAKHDLAPAIPPQMVATPQPPQ